MSNWKENKRKNEKKTMISWMGPFISYAAEIILEIMKPKKMRKCKICDKHATKYGEKYNAIKGE